MSAPAVEDEPQVAAEYAAPAEDMTPQEAVAASAEDSLFSRSPDPETAAGIVADIKDDGVAAASVEPAPAAIAAQPAPQVAPADEAALFAAAPRGQDASDHVKERLMAAVQNNPDMEATAEPEKGGRFAINSLIHRMTGGREEPFPSRQEPTVNVAVDREEPIDQEERDRVEIPAFLRRQAN